MGQAVRGVVQGVAVLEYRGGNTVRARLLHCGYRVAGATWRWAGMAWLTSRWGFTVHDAGAPMPLCDAAEGYDGPVVDVGGEVYPTLAAWDVAFRAEVSRCASLPPVCEPMVVYGL